MNGLISLGFVLPVVELNIPSLTKAGVPVAVLAALINLAGS